MEELVIRDPTSDRTAIFVGEAGDPAIEEFVDEVFSARRE
jgi:hypothetical protein